MATIKVECGLNNPLSSPSREFEINSLGVDINEFDTDIITYNAALLGIVGVCDTILCCCVERVGSTIVVASSCIKDDCLSIVRLVKCIRNYKPDAFDDVLDSSLHVMRAVNAYFFKTEIERAYLTEKYDALEQLIKKVKVTALSYISSVFTDGIVSVSNADTDKIVYVPKSSLIALFSSVTKEELFYGLKLKCENRNVIITSQDFRDIYDDMMIVSKISSDNDDDDREIVLTNAVTKGIVTAMLY